MQVVQHKLYGEGKVISKERKGNDIYILAQFSDGKEVRLAAGSFEIGMVTAEGALKDEVDAIIVAKQEAEEDRRNAMHAIATTSVVPSVVTSNRSGRKPNRPVTVKGPIQTQYEAYLEAAGYPVVGISGNDSTVPQYSRAVEKVVEREGLSWKQLADDIANIVKKYDKDGAEEDYGNRGNKTVINALKRFQEFLEA